MASSEGLDANRAFVKEHERQVHLEVLLGGS